MSKSPARWTRHAVWPSGRARPGLADQSVLQASRTTAASRSDEEGFGGIIACVLIINLACLPLIGLAKIQLASVAVWGFTGLFVLCLLLFGRITEVCVLVVGIAPVLNLLRGALLYSGVPILLAGMVLVIGLGASRALPMAEKPVRISWAMVAGSLAYYLASVLNTGNVRENIRVFELSCTGFLVMFLLRTPKAIRSALYCCIVSGVGVALGSMPHIRSTADQRLGVIALEDIALGNPFTLGMPLALGVLSLCLDRGYWCRLDKSKWQRWFWLAPCVVLLALSTSRASWLVASAGLFLAAMLGRKDRLQILAGIGMVALLAVVLYQTPLAEPFKRGVGRTFDKDRGLNRASTGRSDHWIIFWSAFTDSPKAFLVGYGPGKALDVYADHSMRLPEIVFAKGARVPFHGLIMHIGSEIGVLGLVGLLTLIGMILVNAIRVLRTTGKVLPLAGILGFILASMTVKGFDSISGTLLGMGLSRMGNQRSVGRGTLTGGLSSQRPA